MSEPNNTSTSYDVLILGCGPVGAAMANHLRLYGHSVAIFDRDKDIFECPRAMAYDDETLRLFETIGLLDRIRDEGHTYPSDAKFLSPKGKKLLEFSRATLGDAVNGHHGHYFLSVCDQPSVEKLLRDDFGKGPGTIDTYLGYEALEVDGEGDRATLSAKNLDTGEETTFTGAYLIGCDGLSSLVRRTMKTDRIDLEYSEQYLVVDAIVDDKEYFKDCMMNGGRYRFHPERSGITAKGIHGHLRLELYRHPEHFPDEFTPETDFSEITRNLIINEGFDPDKLRVIRQAPYSFYASTPRHWKKGRMLLAGDAAHVTPPWAGQGLNMGFRDCANLSFKINLVLRGLATDKLIETYQEERQPACLATIKGSVVTGKNMTAERNFAAFMRNTMFLLARNNRSVLRFMHRTGVPKPPYEDGFVGKTHKLSGDAMYQPTVVNGSGKETLLDNLIGMNFALISAKPQSGPHVDRLVNELGGVVLTLGKDFKDAKNPKLEKLARWFSKNKAETVLLRPDRYIFDMGRDGNKLCEAMFAQLH